MQLEVDTKLTPHLANVENVDTNTQPFGCNDLTDAAAYYKEAGYVVIRGLIPLDEVARVNEAFNRQVRDYRGYIYRQTTCDPERHEFSPQGLMLNPVLNVQDLRTTLFGDFKAASLNVITHENVRMLLREVFEGDQGKLIQSMYFEGNPATWAHQDSYYLDSEHLGAMIAGWFATENIDARAGRFFIYPGSHLVDMFRNGGQFDVAFHHSRYKQLVLDTIRDLGLQCKAPALDAGDVLFWNAKTIHGSLQTTDGSFGRRSLTAHYLPTTHRMLQHQSRIRPLSIAKHNGFDVHSPKSLDKVSRRAVLTVETRLPRAFKFAKRAATKSLITVNGLRTAASS